MAKVKKKSRLSEILDYESGGATSRYFVVGIILQIKYGGVCAIIVGGYCYTTLGNRGSRNGLSACAKFGVPRIGVVALFDNATQHSVFVEDVACGSESSRRYYEVVWANHNLDAELLFALELHKIDLPHIEPCSVVVAKAIGVYKRCCLAETNLQIFGQCR